MGLKIAAGQPGLEVSGLDPTQSSSLSQKRKNFIEKVSTAGKDFCCDLYRGDPLFPGLEVPRFAISNLVIEGPADDEWCFHRIEKEVFGEALVSLFKNNGNDAQNSLGQYLEIKKAYQVAKEKLKLAEKTILEIESTKDRENVEAEGELLEAKVKLREAQMDFSLLEDKLVNPLPPNNVVLVDFFEREEIDSNTYRFKIENAIAKTHTICLWKKQETQVLVVDPSNSVFSKRIYQILSAQRVVMHQSQIRFDILSYPGDKFYQQPPAVSAENVNQLTRPKIKSRDCIDIALKIAIVLNTGMFSFNHVNEIENSINLLSNQNLVNPILGIYNNDTLIADLQAANYVRRHNVVREFYSMPSLVKKFYNYSNWKAIQALDDYALIIKTLATFEQLLEKRDLNMFGVEKQHKSNEYQKICIDSIRKLSNYTISAIALKKEFSRIKSELERDFKGPMKLAFEQFLK